MLFRGENLFINPGNFAGLDIPILAGVSGLNVFEKIPVEPYRIFIETDFMIAEIHVIRMSDQENHSSVRRDPIELSLPYVDAILPQRYEKSEVLRQRIRQFDKTLSYPVALYP
jgi:hypothetical protein